MYFTLQDRAYSVFSEIFKSSHFEILLCQCTQLYRLTLLFLPELEDAELVVVLIKQLLLTTAFGTIYFYTPEMFPTEVRNTVLGASSAMGRLSGMVAAFIGGPLVSE